MFSHLLIATDGSKLAKVAINNGVRFAKAIGARVTGFYAAPVYDPRVYEDFSAVGYLSPEEYRKQIAHWSPRKKAGARINMLALRRAEGDKLIAAAGALIRTWFVQRHKQQARAPVLIAGIVSLACAAALVAPSRAPSSSNAPAVKFSDVRAVIVQRCTSCHADKPTQPGFTAAPKGVTFTTGKGQLRSQERGAHTRSKKKPGKRPHSG